MVALAGLCAAQQPADPAAPPPADSVQLNDVVLSRGLFSGSTPGFLSLTWENDSPFHTFLLADDRHFTNGVAIEASLLPSDRAYQTSLDWLDVFDEFDAPRSAVGLMLRHAIYTPEDIDLAAEQPGDWPFGGWLSLGAFLQRREGRVFDHIQIDGGVLGQNAGAQPVQEFVHALLPEQTNPSWAGQIASEAAFLFTYQRRWKLRWDRDEAGRLGLVPGDRLDEDFLAPTKGFELIPFAGLRAGNVFDDLAFGAIARYGSPLPDDFGPTRFYEFTDHTQRPRDELGWSVFARAGARAVLHNALIRGSSFDSQRLDEQVLVGEFQVGLQLEWSGCAFGYSQTVTTTEFEGQNAENRTGTFTFLINLAH
jgi:hypothetical protein